MKKYFLYIPLFILSFFSFKASCQESIETDRPDQSENTHVLEPKEFQVETGVLVNQYKEGKSSVVGSALLRYGLLEKVELRLNVEEGKENLKYFQETAQSRFPIALSAKVGLVEDKKGLPDISFVSYVNLPFLSHPDENTYWAPAFFIALEKKFSKITLQTSEGIKWNNFEKGHSWQATGGITYDLAEKWKIFGEYYGQYEPEESPLHNLDAGLLYQLTKDVQLDLAAGSSIFADEPNSFASLGLSFRIPPKSK